MGDHSSASFTFHNGQQQKFHIEGLAKGIGKFSEDITFTNYYRDWDLIFKGECFKSKATMSIVAHQDIKQDVITQTKEVKVNVPKGQGRKGLKMDQKVKAVIDIRKRTADITYVVWFSHIIIM